MFKQIWINLQEILEPMVKFILIISLIFCREIIFTEPKVLLSPLLDDRNRLFLITQVQLKVKYAKICQC